MKSMPPSRVDMIAIITLLLVSAGCSGSPNPTGESTDRVIKTTTVKAVTATTVQPADSITDDTPTSTQGQSDRRHSGQTIKYTQEDENSSLVVRVDHVSERYDMEIVSYLNTSEYGESSVLSTRYMTQLTLNVTCWALKEVAYNETIHEDTGGDSGTSGNETAPLIKHKPGGETERVRNIPTEVFIEYTPRTLTASVEAKDSGKVLGQCTVVDEDTIERTIFVEE